MKTSSEGDETIMEQIQDQSWVRNAIILGGAAAAALYALNRSSKPEPQKLVESTGDAANNFVQTLSSNQVVRSGERVAALLIGNLADEAVLSLKTTLKDLLHQAEAVVDQI